MEGDQIFRWIFLVVLASALAMSAIFRRRARRSGGVIPRASEGGAMVAARLLFGAPLFLSMIAYVVNPEWMAWSALALPVWLRWLAAALAVAALPWLFWVLKSLGASISETFLTKEGHQLVRHGPYRWVRHPLYSGAALAFISLGVVAANGFILALALAILPAVRLLVIPREEAELTKKFGADYRDYMGQTGRFFPRLAGGRRV